MASASWVLVMATRIIPDGSRAESFAACAILVLTPVKSSAALMGGAIGRWMRRRHSQPLPSLWLMTDEKMGDALLPSVTALPKGSGLVFRHYQTPDRRALFEQVRRIARKRRLLLVLAGAAREAKGWKADGVHSHSLHRSHQLRTAPVHSVRERIKAERAGADLLLVSPIYSSSSHKGARTLGILGFGRLIRGAKRPVIALGGMTPTRARTLKSFNIHGWAGIDALMRQKRSATR